MKYNILGIDDDQNYLSALQIQLRKKYGFLTATTINNALNIINEEDIDLVLQDVSLSNDENGIDSLKQIKQLSPTIPVVMVTAEKDPETIVSAIKSGASDYLCKPFNIDELVAVIEKQERIKTLMDRHDSLLEGLNPIDNRLKMLGTSPSFQTLLEKTERVRGHKANILISGESGTGKELLARYVHSLEQNRHRPFIAVNCAAIPEGLIESELFGHERGSFTGAHSRKIGKFELANGGDIFLDEITSLKPDLQAKILRIIQEKEIVRVGGNAHIPVDFRVISATNDNIENKVEENKFRMDLYHRLKVIELNIPPLRDRQKDIPLLTTHFLKKFCQGEKKRLAPETLKRLQNYSWPGNIRELENVIHSLAILSSDKIITEENLPSWKDSNKDSTTLSIDNPNTISLPDDIDQITLKDFTRDAERLYIKRALKRNRGDKTRTSTYLKMGRTTLYAKLKELNLM